MGRLRTLPRRLSFTRATSAVVILAATAIFGCNPPLQGSLEYSKTHPIKVVDRTFQMDVDLTTTAEGTTPKNWVTLRKFVTEFHRRSKTHLFLLSAPNLTPTERARLISGLQGNLSSLGIQSHQMVGSALSPNPDQKTNVIVISFKGSIAQVPECGDWSGENRFNPTNMPGQNYGCSFQRNIGLMVSNPDNLLKAETGGETLDPASIERIIGLYEAGSPTSAEPGATRAYED